MSGSGKEKPPRLALWLLERVVWSDDQGYAAGDFEEMYRLSVRHEGVLRARIHCWLEVFRSLPGFINNSFYWGMAMLWNYLKVAVRNLARQKGFSFINIAGLAVGVACCLIISLWVYFQLSFDRFHENSSQIYQILVQGDAIKDNPYGPAPVGPTLVSEFPQVAYATRYQHLGRKLVSHGGDDFYETVHAVDASFFQMFNFNLLRGDRADAFPYPNSAVITDDLATKYFGDADPIGQTLTLDTRQSFTVTGVVRHPPTNSSLQFHIIVPFAVKEAEARRETGREMGWGWYSPLTFVQLKEGTDPTDFGRSIRDVPKTHSDDKNAALTILPLAKTYLFFSNGYVNIYIFSTIGLLVLLIASINFVNLSTARSSRRAREVGLRKVVGAFRKNVVHQFLGETIVMAALAVISAVVLAAVALPTLNALTGLRLSLTLVPTSVIVITLLVLVLFLGVAAGSYPALLLSAFKPVTILKSEIVSGERGSLPRRLLVVTQFAVSAILILGTVVIYDQVRFSLEKDPGY
jgi:putative ABC transport system permease protein